MTSWQNAGLPLQSVDQLTVQDLNQHKDNSDLTILDVRSSNEYENGFIPRAKHIYVPHLEETLEELDKNQKIAVYCGTGYRASLAASILQKHGFDKVINIPGSWTAWKNANLPVQQAS
jgi:hydroxyacylglutathione hydrolase